MAGRRYKGVYPTTNFAQLVNDVVEPGNLALFSGELTADSGVIPLGAAKVPGKVVDFWMSVNSSGKDDSNPLQVSGELYINGTTCLSTKPSIAHVSGEAATTKTTKATGDTGIAQAVIDPDARTYSAGDVFTCDLTLVRTGSPTTEMSNLVLVVELEPDA